MNYIFLDIDGVLNNDKWLRELHEIEGVPDHVCPNNVSALKKIIDATGAKIILSSSWRHSLVKKHEDGEFRAIDSMTRILLDKLSASKIYIVGKTESFNETAHRLDLNVEFTRDLEIIDYALNEFSYEDKFVAIDDEDIDEHGILGDRFYRTSFSSGLTYADADAIIKLFNAD